MAPIGEGKRRQHDAGGSVVGALLRARRREAGLSQQALARQAGLALTVLRRIEQGRNASLESVGRVTAVFGPETQRGVVLMLTLPRMQRRALMECWRLERELQRSAQHLRRVTTEGNSRDHQEVATECRPLRRGRPPAASRHRGHSDAP
jgi:DNA-binding XRE family transcriptional regulator